MADAPAAGDTGAPKIQVDSDWKAQAQKEKERLAKQEQQKAKSSPAGGSLTGEGAGVGQGAGPAPGGLPQADFRTLVGMLAQQAIMGLGVVADQQSGRVVVDLEGSRFSIDLLDVLEQKTKNNLSKEETDELKQILAELRSRFVQISNLVARQMAAQAQAQVKAATEPKVTT
jgi:hypothetical protein